MLMVVHDGWLPFTKGFRSACCTKFRFLSSRAYLLQSERSRLILGLRVLQGGKGPSAGIVLRLIQEPRIADSSSTNAVSFSSGAHVPAQPLQHQTHCKLVNRPFRFQKCCEDFIGTHNERLSVFAL